MFDLLRGVVDEIGGNVSVLSSLDLLLDVEKLAVLGDCIELLSLGSIRLGAFWAAQAVILADIGVMTMAGSGCNEGRSGKSRSDDG